MCRSIKKLRQTDPPATGQEIKEAALQFVRKVSGYRVPSKRIKPSLITQLRKWHTLQKLC